MVKVTAQVKYQKREPDCVLRRTKHMLLAKTCMKTDCIVEMFLKKLHILRDACCELPPSLQPVLLRS